MKCSNCGAEIPASSRRCSQCKKAVPQDFNYNNMEKELLNTVLEEEAIDGISGKSALYQRRTEREHSKTEAEKNQYELEEDEESGDEEEEAVKKQPGKLAAALLAGAAVFAGTVFFLQTFSTDFEYNKKETGYQNCLEYMAQEDYTGALRSVELLLQEEKDSLEYLALKNTICEKSGDKKTQEEVLNRIIAADKDNYQAYEKLLALYLDREDQEAIVKLADQAPNSAVAAMLKEYLVEAPYLELTPGVYGSSQSLVITSENGNSIYYTLDGSSPQERGVLYVAPIPLELDRFYSVRAVCKNERGAYGEESAGEYQIGINAVNNTVTSSVAEPTVYPEGGTYSSPQRITIGVPIGCQAYYSWTAGTELTPQSGTLYTGGIEMPQGSSVLSVIVTDASGNTSPVKQVSYTYQQAMTE